MLRTLAVASAAGATAAITGLARAQGTSDKFKPEDVAYQTTPKDDQRCSNCAKFTAPNICSILTKRVVPSGWCTAWQVKPT
jgi:hypothetical protein